MQTKLEKLFGRNWKVMGSVEDGFELEDWSPEGEDVIITLWGATLAELAHYAFEAYQDFDPEAHAAEIYLGKHGSDFMSRADAENAARFYANAPDSLTDLLRDAKAIQRMYKSVADRLAKAARKEAA